MALPPVQRFMLTVLAFALASVIAMGPTTVLAEDSVRADAKIERGICVLLGLPEAKRPESVIELAAETEALVYFQSPDAKQVSAVRAQAAARGLLGKRVFAELGDLASIHLANNLADRVHVAESVAHSVSKQEVLRVLCPAGRATLGKEHIVKPIPHETDSWSHVYHGPDNNPQSTDEIARAPYRTQFLAGPLFSPMPEVTVAAGGRIFKAFGHIAHKANQNAVLNTLYCINAFNGTTLWKRPLSRNFMIHRSTMIATPEQFYLADDTSCKLIDPATGTIRAEIVVPDGLADGPVWKWMALQDGVLYALVGGEEIPIDTINGSRRGIGHWPWGMWKGHDYADPSTNFGFGRTFLAIDPETKQILWSYRDDDFIDSRGVCMRNGRIYFYCPEKFLGCLDTATEKVVWKNSDYALLGAIGANARAQHYVTGYATTSYIKCNDKQLFFAGPQRPRFVVASTADGHLLWQKPQGNVQIVLRDDGIYCAGPQLGDNAAGAKYSYDGKRLMSLPIRRACTRATGSIDGVFYRTSGGTVRVDTATNTAQHIAPMRPPCQDGVLISDGLLFWGPWMCGCQLSLYGHISLGPADAKPAATAPPESQLQLGPGDVASIETCTTGNNDWPAYQHDNARSSFTRQTVPNSVKLAWQYPVVRAQLPTAPIVVGDIVFVADRSGTVQAIGNDGKQIWSVRTGGPIYYPPTFDSGRLFVGSADGRVYALEAASGRLLWSYRVAPQARWIPVYGRLISTWPVAGGVAVQDGVVYAAAGIAHYDSTYVVALNAADGKTIWRNNRSGRLADDVNCGISLQGELQLRGDELQFLGGGAYQFARYDRKMGACLNPASHKVTSQFQTAFYPYFPQYAKYSSLNHTFLDGRTLQYFSSYDGSRPSPLAMLAPRDAQAPAQHPADRGDKAPVTDRRDNKKRPPRRRAIWQTDGPRLFTAFVLTPDTLIAAGPGSGKDDPAQLAAMSLKDGSLLWQQALDALPVKAGIALDGKQRILVTLEDGQLLCFGPAE